MRQHGRTPLLKRLLLECGEQLILLCKGLLEGLDGGDGGGGRSFGGSGGGLGVVLGEEREGSARGSYPLTTGNTHVAVLANSGKVTIAPAVVTTDVPVVAVLLAVASLATAKAPSLHG